MEQAASLRSGSSADKAAGNTAKKSGSGQPVASVERHLAAAEVNLALSQLAGLQSAGAEADAADAAADADQQAAVSAAGRQAVAPAGGGQLADRPDMALACEMDRSAAARHDAGGHSMTLAQSAQLRHQIIAYRCLKVRHPPFTGSNIAWSAVNCCRS